MCPPGTRTSAWRFRLHRLTAGLCALALTVNAALIAVMISADVNAYQVPRAGVAGNQWWLAPLRWHFVEYAPPLWMSCLTAISAEGLPKPDPYPLGLLRSWHREKPDSQTVR